MRIYFTSDLHGSEKCWKKLLATPNFYSVDVIIVGGDITGKFIIPIIKQSNGSYEATFLGRLNRLKEADLTNFITQINNSGYYPFITDKEEYELYKNSPYRVEELFHKMLLERVEHWIELADARLAGQKVQLYIQGGNDDMFEVDNLLAKSKVMHMPEGNLVDVDGFEMISLGYANITPWNCTRDIPEEALSEKINALAGQIKTMGRAIFNIHVPPYDSGIDLAPKLTEDLKVVVGSNGEPVMLPVGSTAVRDAILKYQPMLALHGHIHESKGYNKMGKTTIVNPGSEYGEGILRGAIIELDSKKGITRINLVSG
jgi:uncharacterized protein